jgi:hypothetical protein
MDRLRGGCAQAAERMLGDDGRAWRSDMKGSGGGPVAELLAKHKAHCAAHKEEGGDMPRYLCREIRMQHR